jgi:hypothetical protein
MTARYIVGGLHFLLTLLFGFAMNRNQSFEGARCTACDTLRRFVGSEPAAHRYEIRSYECPVCKSVLRMVERAEPSMFPRRWEPDR